MLYQRLLGDIFSQVSLLGHMSLGDNDHSEQPEIPAASMASTIVARGDDSPVQTDFGVDGLAGVSME